MPDASESEVPGAAPTGDDAIHTERMGDHLLIIRIDRPHRRNAIDHPTSLAIERVIDAYKADDSLYCAIITGSSEVFCAGADLIALAYGASISSHRRGLFGILEVPPVKPIIAAVEGHALAGGLELSLSCDLIVSSSSASMGIPEAARSLVAVGGGLLRLPKRIPYHLAMELALTGKPWPATRMAELGLVNRITAPGQALAGAIELAEEVMKAGPLAVKASKQIVQHALDWDDATGWKEQTKIAAPVLKSEDMQEGLKAFAEKREPVWKAR